MPKKIDPALIPPAPNLYFENTLWAQGVEYVAGVDEAGRGALAGPVSAAVVIFPQIKSLAKHLKGVDDSKQMSAKQRTYWADVIQDTVIAFGVGFTSSQEVDEIVEPLGELAGQPLGAWCRGTGIRDLAQVVDPVEHERGLGPLLEMTLGAGRLGVRREERRIREVLVEDVQDSGRIVGPLVVDLEYRKQARLGAPLQVILWSLRLEPLVLELLQAER